MTFYEKYPQLKEREFLTNILSETVYTTMSLEAQDISKEKALQIVTAVLDEQELKGFKFSTNKIR